MLNQNDIVKDDDTEFKSVTIDEKIGRSLKTSSYELDAAIIRNFVKNMLYWSSKC